MSSHEARYEDTSAYDESASKTARPDDQSHFSFARKQDRDDTTDRDTTDRDTVVGDGPVLLPVDPGPEPTTDHDPIPDSAPVTIVDGEKVTDGRSDDRDPITGVKPDGTGDKADDDLTPPTSSEVSVGPDTESGALKDPVADQTSATDETSAVAAAAGSSTTGSTATTSPEVDWRELQGRFVDDPQAAVKEAGELVEKAFTELRSRSESGSTEDLRTAFRRYRDLYSGLT